MIDTKRAKVHTRILIGVALLVLAACLFYAYFKTSDFNSKTVSESAVVSAQTPDNSATTKPQVTYPLDVNTATVEELMTIDGLGYKRASLIVEYRKEIGEYKSLDQLKNISGFGDATLEKISPYLKV